MENFIKIPSANGSGNLEALRQSLLASCGRPTVIDGQHCKGLSACVAQVLLAAARQWKNDGKSLEIRLSEQAKLDVIRLGLSEEVKSMELDGDH